MNVGKGGKKGCSPLSFNTTRQKVKYLEKLGGGSIVLEMFSLESTPSLTCVTDIVPQSNETDPDAPQSIRGSILPTPRDQQSHPRLKSHVKFALFKTWQCLSSKHNQLNDDNILLLPKHPFNTISNFVHFYTGKKKPFLFFWAQDPDLHQAFCWVFFLNKLCVLE